jgi:pSer/pThr/pTyr-binding forkhead associated (FHA) protein
MIRPSRTTSQRAAESRPALVAAGRFDAQSPFYLDRPVTLIGSRHRAHIRLESSEVSRSHAVVVHTEGRVYLRDLGSRTRVYVNGHETWESELADGDYVTIGHFSFRFASGRRDPASGATEGPAGILSGPMLPAGAAALDRPLCVIGCRTGSDVLLRGSAVSFAHAVIVRHESGHVIRDLGSRTGTFLNGVAVEGDAELWPGCVVRIGPYELTYTAAAAGRRQPQRAPAMPERGVLAEALDHVQPHQDPVSPRAALPAEAPVSDAITDLVEATDAPEPVAGGVAGTEDDSATALTPAEPPPAEQPAVEPSEPSDVVAAPTQEALELEQAAVEERSAPPAPVAPAGVRAATVPAPARVPAPRDPPVAAEPPAPKPRVGRTPRKKKTARVKAESKRTTDIDTAEAVAPAEPFNAVTAMPPIRAVTVLLPPAAPEPVPLANVTAFVPLPPGPVAAAREPVEVALDPIEPAPDPLETQSKPIEAVPDRGGPSTETVAAIPAPVGVAPAEARRPVAAPADPPAPSEPELALVFEPPAPETIEEALEHLPSDRAAPDVSATADELNAPESLDFEAPPVATAAAAPAAPAPVDEEFAAQPMATKTNVAVAAAAAQQPVAEVSRPTETFRPAPPHPPARMPAPDGPVKPPVTWGVLATALAMSEVPIDDGAAAMSAQGRRAGEAPRRPSFLKWFAAAAVLLVGAAAAVVAVLGHEALLKFLH